MIKEFLAGMAVAAITLFMVVVVALALGAVR